MVGVGLTGSVLMADLKGNSIRSRWDGGFGVYPMGFLCALGTTCWWTALPFIIVRLGGSDGDVGLTFGIYTGTYLACCLLGRVVLGGVDPKWLVKIGLGACVVPVGLVVVIMMLAGSGLAWRPLLMVKLAGVLFGMVQSLVWPFTFSWISSGYKGSALSRRLGYSMGSMAAGGLISPAVTGLVIERNDVLAMVMCAGSFVICSLCAWFTPGPRGGDTGVVNGDEIIEVEPTHDRLVSFLWISRIGLLSGVICSILVRVQLPLLLTLELGFRKYQFGFLITAMACATLLVHLVNRRVSAWHYRRGVFVLLSASFPASMIIILYSDELWAFMVAAILTGFGFAFLFSSHLFYGTEGSRSRSARMSVHEIIMGLGMVAGSVGGGYLGEYIDRRMPYKLALVCLGVGAVLQLCVWFFWGTKKSNRGF
jgi:MFS family permease